MAELPREVTETAKSIGDITLKLTVDVSDALTAIKAVERRAREAKQTVAEIGAESYSMSVSEIERLADYILHNYGHEPGRTGESESAVDVAIRLLTERSEGVLTKTLREYHRIQGADGNWNHDDYMRGMYNAFELLMTVVDGREPVFKEDVIPRDLATVSTADLVAELGRRDARPIPEGKIESIEFDDKVIARDVE